MKKRIISLILVLVTLCLTLAGCGAYSIANESVNSYVAAPIDKAAFEAALKELQIEDGEFAQSGSRDDMAWDKLFEVFAAQAELHGAEKFVKGIAKENSVVSYQYNYTYTDEAGVVYYFNDNLNPSNASELNLLCKDLTSLEKELKTIFTTTDIDGFIYTTSTSGTAAENAVVYVSYKLSYDEDKVDENGNVVLADDGKPVKVRREKTITNERRVLTKDANFNEHLIGKTIKGTAENAIPTYLDNTNGLTYENITINWVSTGEKQFRQVSEVTYTEDKKVKDIFGEEHNLKDRTLTYNIYPVNFYNVPEYTDVNIINIMLSSSQNYSIDFDEITGALFGLKFAELEEAEKTAILDLYKITDPDGNEFTLEEFVESVSNARKDYEAALKTTKASEAVKNTKDNEAIKAKTEYDKNPTDEAKKKSYEDALKALQEQFGKYEYDKKISDEKLKIRDDKVQLLIAKINEQAADGRNQLADGYKKYVYDILLANYNAEIKLNLANEIEKLIEKYVVLNETLPQGAIDAAFDVLMENEEYKFYNETKNNAGTQISYYSYYNGDFKEYLAKEIAGVNGTYDLAVQSLKEKAINYAKPVLRMYALSDVYGVRVDDKAFEQYKDENRAVYDLLAEEYGENSVRYAHQFDKLMNHLLDRGENKDDLFAVNNGVYTYNDKVAFTIKASESK